MYSTASKITDLRILDEVKGNKLNFTRSINQVTMDIKVIKLKRA